ncbi:hypothetical protein [Bdellovibrio sp. HCB274]|uniref:hypothetical protein n=1 Tax=Bdellovibrio sp. HCB274 TaxID=3394361 RepID=UPI0039B58215
MKLSLHKILVLGLCLIVGACAFKKEDAEDKQRQELAEDVAKQMQEDQKNAGVDLKRDNVSVKFEDGTPGRYTLRIQWPEAVGTMEVFINDQLVEAVSGRSYYSSEVLQGEILVINLRAFASVSNGGRFLSDLSDKFFVPRDLIFKNNVELTSNFSEDVHRIYFWQNGRIISNGYSVKLKADLLVVEDEDAYQTGLPEQDSHITSILTDKSKSPDLISIDAKKAVGTLRISMSGANGKNGRNGNDFAIANGLSVFTGPAAAGASGSNGVGKMGRPCNPGSRGFCEPIPPSCSVQPTNGQAGANGVAGNRGEDAENGFNTGNANITVTNNDEFVLEVYQTPGLGGTGGAGSPGQPGGAGGAPGNRTGNCTPASPGPRGTDGADGERGDNGSSGEFGEVKTDVKNIKVIQRTTK